MNWLKLGLLATGLTLWYSCTGVSNSKKSEDKYELPQEIVVLETSLPYEIRRMNRIITEYEEGKPDGFTRKESYLEKIIKTRAIDFSHDFDIKTDRYRLVKDDDWLPSRLVGHVLSIPARLYFWDWQVSWGVDGDRARSVLAFLEENKNLKDLTVRLNHNEAWYDCYRLFEDEKLVERNNFLARLFLGVTISLKNEIWAEFFRGDYYNPMTQTVVIYSNVESIAAHELGHHKDFQRFNSDWEYILLRPLPPVMLYQEWKASSNAKNMLSNDDKYQFYRYLLPAFFTYCMACYYSLKKLKKKYIDEDD